MAESDLIDGWNGLFAEEMTVYASLRRMAADGLIVGEWTVCDGRRRRRYRLTGLGRRMLELTAPRQLSRVIADARAGDGSGA